MKTCTNAVVQPLHSPWRADGLDWEIRGYICGSWVNIPHKTEEAAKAHLAEILSYGATGNTKCLNT